MAKVTTISDQITNTKGRSLDYRSVIEGEMLDVVNGDNIPNSYIGMIVYSKADDAYYKVTEINSLNLITGYEQLHVEEDLPITGGTIVNGSTNRTITISPDAEIDANIKVHNTSTDVDINTDVTITKNGTVQHRLSNKIDNVPDNNLYLRKKDGWTVYSTPSGQVQSDWTETNTEAGSYIQNKPDLTKLDYLPSTGGTIFKDGSTLTIGSDITLIKSGSTHTLSQKLEDAPRTAGSKYVRENGSWVELDTSGAYIKPSGGIPKSDLNSNVQASLDKADSAASVNSNNTFTGTNKFGSIEIKLNEISWGDVIISEEGIVMSDSNSDDAININSCDGSIYANELHTPMADGEHVEIDTGIKIVDSDDNTKVNINTDGITVYDTSGATSIKIEDDTIETAILKVDDVNVGETLSNLSDDKVDKVIGKELISSKIANCFSLDEDDNLLIYPDNGVIVNSLDIKEGETVKSVATEEYVNNYHDSSKQNTISDLATIRSGAALGATALQSFTETDPTVPSWAKASSKPSYALNELTNVDIKGIKVVSSEPTSTSDDILYIVLES